MPIDNWIDEEGNDVEEISFFERVYTDKKSRNLKYNPNYRLREIDNQGFHTSHETHAFAETLAKIYHSIGKFVGFEILDLEKYAEFRNCYGEQITLLNMGFLRSKKIKGKKVLFPKEKLIKLGFEARKI